MNTSITEQLNILADEIRELRNSMTTIMLAHRERIGSLEQAIRPKGLEGAPDWVQPVTQATESDAKPDYWSSSYWCREAKVAMKERDKAREARDIATRELKRAREEAAEARASRDKLKGELNDMRNERNKARMDCNELRSKLAGLDRKNEDSQIISDLLKQRDNYAANLRVYRKMLDEMRTLLGLQMGEDIVTHVSIMRDKVTRMEGIVTTWIEKHMAVRSALGIGEAEDAVEEIRKLKETLQNAKMPNIDYATGLYRIRRTLGIEEGDSIISAIRGLQGRIKQLEAERDEEE